MRQGLPISLAEVREAVTTSGITVRGESNGVMKLSVPHSVLHTNTDLHLETSDGNSTVTLVASPIQVFGIVANLVLFAACLGYVLWGAMWRLLAWYNHRTLVGDQSFLETVPEQVVAGLAVVSGLLIVYELGRASRLLARLPRTLRLERRLLAVPHESLNRELASLFFIYPFLGLVFLFFTPSFFGPVYIPFSLLSIAACYWASLQHPVSQQRSHTLFHITDEAFSIPCLILYGSLGMGFVLVQCLVLHQVMNLRVGTDLTPELLSSSVRWIFNKPYSQVHLTDFLHALDIFPSVKAKFGALRSLNAPNLMVYLVFYGPLMLLSVAFIRHQTRLWRAKTRNYGLFHGIAPEVCSERMWLFVAFCWIKAISLTLLALWVLFGSVLTLLHSALLYDLPDLGFLHPLRISAALSSSALYSPWAAPLFSVILAVPGLTLVLEWSILAGRDIITYLAVTKATRAKSKDHDALVSSWRSHVQGMQCPRLRFSHDASLPETRFMIVPPFRYVAIPTWFTTGMLSGEGIAAVLAHEHYHYSTKWKRTTAHRALGALFFRCPAVASVMEDGTGELAADEHAIALLGVDGPTFFRRIRAVGVAEARSRMSPGKKSFGARLSKVLESHLPSDGGFVSVYPSLDERERRANIGKTKERSSGSGRLDFVFPWAAAAVCAMVVIAVQHTVANIKPSQWPGRFENTINYSRISGIQDIEGYGDSLVVAFARRLALLDLRTNSIMQEAEVPLPSVSKIVAVDGGYLATSSFRGASVSRGGEWIPVAFTGTAAPAVFDASTLGDPSPCYLATSDGVWRTNPPYSVALQVNGTSGHILYVSATRTGALFGSDQGLYRLEEPDKVVELGARPVRYLTAAEGGYWAAFADSGFSVLENTFGLPLPEKSRFHGVPPDFELTADPKGHFAILYKDIPRSLSQLIDGSWSSPLGISPGTAPRCVSYADSRVAIADGTGIYVAGEDSLVSAYEFPLIPSDTRAFTIDGEDILWAWSRRGAWLYSLDSWRHLDAVPTTPERRQSFLVANKTESGAWLLLSPSTLFEMRRDGSAMRHELPIQEGEEVTSLGITDTNQPMAMVKSQDGIEIRTFSVGLDSIVRVKMTDKPYFSSLYGEGDTVWFTVNGTHYAFDVKTRETRQYQTQGRTTAALALGETTYVVASSSQLSLIDSEVGSVKILAELPTGLASICTTPQGDILAAILDPPQILRVNRQGDVTIPYGPHDEIPPFDQILTSRDGRVWGKRTEYARNILVSRN